MAQPAKYDQVVQAFRDLTEAGETPTQDKIKTMIWERTGVKMSNSTVTKHLQTLRSCSPDEFLKVAESDEQIPADLMPAVVRAVNHIRRTVELSHSTVQIEKLEAEIGQLQEKLENWEHTKSELSGLRYAYEAQLKRTEALIRENEGLKAGVAPDAQGAMEELNAQLEAIATERNQLIVKIEQLSSTNQELTNNTTILQNRLESAMSDRTSLETRCSELAIANGQLEPALQQLAEAKKTIEALQKQLALKNNEKNTQAGTLAGEVEYLHPRIWEAIEREFAIRSSKEVQKPIEELEEQTATFEPKKSQTEQELIKANIVTRRQIMNHIKSPGDRINGTDGSTWQLVGRDESRKGKPNTYHCIEQ